MPFNRRVYGSLGEHGYFIKETPLPPNSPYSASKASADYPVLDYMALYANGFLKMRHLKVAVKDLLNSYFGGFKQFLLLI